MNMKSVLGVIFGISLITTLGATNLIQHDAGSVRPRGDGIALAPVALLLEITSL